VRNKAITLSEQPLTGKALAVGYLKKKKKTSNHVDWNALSVCILHLKNHIQ